MGMGPMTGRAAGFCGGSGMPGYMNPIPGRGMGMGFGRGRGFGGRGGGRGWRNWFRATGLTGWQRAAMGYADFGGPGPYPNPSAATPAQTMTAEQQADMLKSQAEYLQDELTSIRKRIEELEAQGKQG